MQRADRVLSLLLACALAGCAADRVPPDAVTSSPCPSTLTAGIRLAASVAQVAVPDGVQEPSGSVKLIAGVGRRVLLSIEVPEEALPRVRLLESSLALYTFGGTLAGWVRNVRPAAATGRQSLEVSGGYLRIAPFVPGSKLRTYAQTIDVLVVPGGAPVSGLALRPGAMWNRAGAPIAPRELQFALEPIEHMTALTVVDATAQFEFTALHIAPKPERFECAIKSDFRLVDHDAVRPALWTLQHPQRRGSAHGTIALYSPSVGAFPAVFLDPDTAAGFARWLRETGATRVGTYQLGMIAAEEATNFRPAGAQELAELMVERMGSD
jgi:hypothetical protein